MPGGFQSQVNVQPAPAVAGDFASANPRATLDVGPGGLVSGSAGLTVGAFAWTVPPVDPDNTNMIAQSFAPPVSSVGVPTGGTSGVAASTPMYPAGFVHREGQALITTFLADATMVIPQGFPVNISTQGDFWVKNSGTSQALIGQKAFALINSGLAVFAAAGGTGAFSSAVTGSVGPLTSAFTGSILGDVLTVTATSSGTLTPGAYVYGTVGGTTTATGTQIVSQISGATGGTGAYLVSIAEQNVSSGSLTSAYSLLSVTGSGVFSLIVGDLLSGTAMPPGVVIAGFGTGTGGLGTYYLNTSGVTAASSVFSVQGAVETKWYAASSGATGELVKISSWVGTQG